MKGFGVLASVLALTSVAGMASAQMTVEKPVRVLLGVQLPQNGNKKALTAFGASYDFGKSKAENPLVYGVFVDHASGKVNGRNRSLTALGVSGRFYQNSANDAARTYGLLGIANYSFNQGGGNEIGFKLGGGYELNNGFFGELDYTNANNYRAIQARIGFRF